MKDTPSNREELKEKFHQWCLEQNATDIIRVSIVLASSPDFWLKELDLALSQERNRVVKIEREKISDHMHKWELENRNGNIWSDDYTDGFNRVMNEIEQHLSLITNKE